MSAILFPDAIQSGDPVGGKARALADLRRCELDAAIPPWFVVLAGSESPASRELDDAIARLDANCFAVRSSDLEEDGETHSFAGQFDSFLFVERDAVSSTIDAVRTSGSSPRLRAYREATGVPATLNGHSPAVIVQKMIDPEAAGVVFSADPVTGRRDHCVLSAVPGTGDKLVSGEADADTWTVAHEGGAITKRATVTPGAALSESEIRRIAVAAARLESHFGSPQDVEWALSDGELFILQSRPITALPEESAGAEEGSELGIWDNSNIVESYAGVTTPLTFSFAQRAYEHVYRQFCIIMRVPRSRIETGDETFKRMLGLIRGRIYYNLINWYRVLAMLPGFRTNRSFMEQMMGVKEAMPDEVVASVEAECSTGRLRDLLNLVATAGGLAWNHATLSGRSVRFQRRLDAALAPPSKSLKEMSGRELVEFYEGTEEQLLRQWDAPIVNDFFAMIYFGVLRGLCRKWAGDEVGSLANELVGNTGGITSLEPVTRMRAMGELTRNDPALRKLLGNSELSTAEKVAGLRAFPTFSRAFQSYLDKFGDRCLEELKLESVPLTDDPSLLLQSIYAFASRPVVEPACSEAAEDPARKALGSMNVAQRFVFRRVLQRTCNRVRDRENLRFERTRVFGLVRRIMLEIGERLALMGALADFRDVFYLELEEALGAFRGAANVSSFKETIAERKIAFAAWRAGPAPPDRFETRGTPGDAPLVPGASFPEPAPGGSTLAGTGCCAGVVRGRVRLVTDPASADLREGEILAARQTDPGWVMLFPLAAGLLVERGSLLSHSAIVSREMGLPAIVSLPSLTAWIRTGDVVEMDGRTGMVRRIEEGEMESP